MRAFHPALPKEAHIHSQQWNLSFRWENVASLSSSTSPRLGSRAYRVDQGATRFRVALDD